MLKSFAVLAVCTMLASCAVPAPPKPSAGHIQTPAAAPGVDASIPEPVTRSPYLPPPEATPTPETYTVVVNDVPVRELLFALARDAKVNVDIHPDITGNVTMNAVDQTLPRILQRLSRQVDLRYQMEDDNISVMPDRPYLKIYHIDYINMSRELKGTISASTEVLAEGGDESTGSTTSIENASQNNFWDTLSANLNAIITEPSTKKIAVKSANNIIINRENGVVTVRAKSGQHELVQSYLDSIQRSSIRQVLIEATVVEVTLSDLYKSGIDWAAVAKNAGALSSGFNLAATGLVGAITRGTTGGFGGDDSSFFTAKYFHPGGSPTDGRDITATVDLLKKFGNAKVLSSPKMMTLNNQSAIIKVVTNVVYFEIDSEVVPATVVGALPTTSVDTNAKTVAVGLLMTVTPQISDNGSVILNIRPTLSSITGSVTDPNPNQGAVLNTVPILETREMESVMRIDSGQVAVLGGLMTDKIQYDKSSIPGASDLGGFGDALLSARRQGIEKTELVVFIRPTVIKNASIDHDLHDFRQYLEP